MVGYDKTFSGAFDCFLELDKVIWVLKTYCDMSVNAELEVSDFAKFFVLLVVHVFLQLCLHCQLV